MRSIVRGHDGLPVLDEVEEVVLTDEDVRRLVDELRERNVP